MSKSRKAILTPQMGFGGMDETQTIVEALSKLDIPVHQPDLDDLRKLQSIPWDEIGLVEFRDMRGALSDFRRFTSITGAIFGKLVSELGDMENIPCVPPLSATQWLFNKSTYFKFLMDVGVKTIPTEIFHTGHHPESSIEVGMQIASYLMKCKYDRFVLKPARGALASKILFVERRGEHDFIATWYESSKRRTLLELDSQNGLFEFLIEYTENLSVQYADIFVQEYIPSYEVSAVYIGGSPHFVSRRSGAKNIAHENFGGTNEILTDPDRSITDFAAKAYKLLPPAVQKSLYLRIDIVVPFHERKLMLGEIEGAAATRLWLRESGRVDEYANLIASRIRS